MSPFTPHSTSARTTRALLTATIAACSLSFAADAQATQINGDTATFTVSDGIEGGQAPLGADDVYAVDVATVGGQSVWKITTSSPIRLIAGDCTRISGANNVAGPSEIHCKRAAEPGESTAILGDGNDQFIAAPGFPDRLRLVGQDGDDVLVGGIRDDVLNGGDGDNALTGNEGNDSLTFGTPARTQFGNFPNGKNSLAGGPGDDFLFGGDGDDLVDGGDGNDSLGGGRGVDTINGGEGDDTLNGTEDAFNKRDSLTGGGGTDAFTGDVLDQIFARDGIAERVGCRSVRFLTDPLAFAEVDLKDTIVFGDPCPTVLRAPKDEAPAVKIGAGSVKVVGGRARIRITCTTPTLCKGTVKVRMGKKSGAEASTTYDIAGGATKVIAVKLKGSSAKKVSAKGVKATATLIEAGIAGDRTVIRPLTLKR